MKARITLGGVVATILSAYAYVFFEWVFLVTQRGFMVSFRELTQATALAITPLPLLLFALPITLLLVLIERLTTRTSIRKDLALAILPAAVILTALAILLLDNFTYTILGVGIVTTGPVVRFFYIPVLVLLFESIARSLYRARQRWIVSGVPRSLTAVSSLLVVGSIVVCVARLATGGVALEAVPHHPKDSLRPWNVLLVTIDGVEARRTSAYGYERRTTPFMETFRERALVFENAFSNAGRTTASITSILSSKPPSATKVIFPPHILVGQDSFEHLPGELRRAGYETHQFSVRYYADGPDLNMREAFDRANGRDASPDRWKRIGRVFPAELYFAERLWERSTERILYIFGLRRLVNHFKVVQLPTDIYGDQSDRGRIDHAVDAARKASRPFFIHVHLMGTHCCGFAIGKRVFSTASKTNRDDVLDDAILQADGEVQRLIAELDGQGFLRNTVVVITSDHSANWQTKERVPLMISLPNRPSGGVESANVQLLDLAPTVLDAVNLQVPSWMQGRSLLREVRRPSYIESTGEIEKEVVDANWERISRLRDPSPPLYGLSTIGAIVCDKWLEVNLLTGQAQTGIVDGHTAPCPARLLPGAPTVGSELLLALQRRGFELPPDREWVRDQRSIKAATWKENPPLDKVSESP